MAAILADIGSVFSGVMSWAGSVGTAILDSDLLLIGVSIPIVGAGIGFFRRLLRLR